MVLSERQPLHGQKHRSSQNFTFKPPAGCTGLLWTIKDEFAEEEDVNRTIHVDIYQDKSGKDPIIVKDLTDNQQTAILGAGEHLYVANPKGANQSFTVNVYAKIETEN